MGRGKCVERAGEGHIMKGDDVGLWSVDIT
jgi:hypothetical protein